MANSKEQMAKGKGQMRSALLSILALNLAACFGGEPAAQDQLAAKVNDEPIYEKGLCEGLPKDAFSGEIKSIKEMKLGRAIQTALLRQFLNEQHVVVEDAVVEAAIAELRKNPPVAPCACCYYPTFELFLEQNYYTLAEYRQVLRGVKGLAQYLDALWKKTYPDAASLAALAQQKRAAIDQEYFKTWHILFNASDSLNGVKPPEQIEQETEAKAQAAWQRLQKGEDFAKLAKELSKDKTSAPNGGYIGCISRERSPFGLTATAALAALKPGAYSQPLSSPWGYHILKREALTDDDILSILKESFMADKEDEVYVKVNKSAKIECFPPYKQVRP